MGRSIANDENKTYEEKKWNRLLWGAGALWSTVILGTYIWRCFDPNFWGDEAYTLFLIRRSVWNILKTTAADVHPPLYYLILKGLCAVFGSTPFVFRFTSLLPAIIEVILLMTIGFKKLGWRGIYPTLLLLTLSRNPIRFHLEVRMYSWGALFIVLAWYFLYRILTENRRRDYIWFVAASLGAAFTQYYCLISVAFFYMVLLLVGLIRKDSYRTRSLIASAATIAIYLPWLVIFLKTISRTAGNYWIEEVLSPFEGMKYLFNGKYRTIVLLLWILFMGVTLLHHLGWFSKLTGLVEKTGKDGMMAIWMLAGLCSIIGTLGVGIAVSILIRPMMITRYLYPVSHVAWLLFGVSVAGKRKGSFLCIILCILLLAIGIPEYHNTILKEMDIDARYQETIAATKDRIDKGDLCYTNHSHISWTVGGYYYPGTRWTCIDDDEPIPELEAGKEIWLVLRMSHENEDVLFAKWCAAGYEGEEVVHEGSFGTYNVCIYRLRKQ